MGIRTLCLVLSSCLLTCSFGEFTSLGKFGCRRNANGQDPGARESAFVAVTLVATVDECKSLCDSISACHGIEYHSATQTAVSAGNCEIWKVRILGKATKTDANFECFNKTKPGVTPADGFKDAASAGFTLTTPEDVQTKLGDADMVKNTSDCVKMKFTNAKPDTTMYNDIQVTDVKLKRLSNSSMHVEVVCSANTTHVADLHNALRALKKNHKYLQAESDLQAHQHSLINEMQTCVSDNLNMTGVTAKWDTISLLTLKAKGQSGQSGQSGGTTKKPSGSPSGNTTKTFKQSVTAKMTCTDANKTMADLTKAKAAFKKAFEKSGGATVTDTALTKMGCGRRLETGFRKLSGGDPGIKADFTYTAAAAKTVDANVFKTDLNKALADEGISGVTVTSADPSAATDVTPTQAPASTTKKTASSARKTSLFFVTFSFVQLALVRC